MPRCYLRASVVILLISACGGAGAPPPSAPYEFLGKPVELSLPTDRGQLGAVPAPGAPVTVADFFGPTCKPCREKVPALWAKKGELERSGARLVLIGVLGDGETTDDARKALDAWGVSGASFLVDSGTASKTEAGLRELPTTLVLDAKGVVRWAASSSATAADVVAAAGAAR